MKIKSKTTLCLVVIILVAAVGCDKSEIPPENDNNVSFTPCLQSKMKSSSELSDKVDVEFTGKGVQITHLNFEVPCDFTTVNVTHTFVNGVLNIIQQGTPNQADCVCYSDVSYTIDGILQSEVNVIFINRIQVYCYNDKPQEPCHCIMDTLKGEWSWIKSMAVLEETPLITNLNQL